MTCNQKEVGLLSAIGQGKTARKALNKALKGFLDAGGAACLGGACDGGSCGFFPTSIQLSYSVDVRDKGIVHEVHATGTGQCACE